MRNYYLIVALVALAAGCDAGKKQPDFPALHPVKGVVKKGGAAASGGLIQFTPQDDKGEFLVTAVVGADGAFTLSTVRTTDSTGERKPGAPAGLFKVTYTPPLGDQTAGGVVTPVLLSTPIPISAGDNNLTVELPAKK